MGSFLAPFRPSGPLCFPVRQGAFSASGGRAAAATGAAGGFCVSLYKQWYRSLFFRCRRQGRQPLNSAPPAPHEYADKCVTSVPERLELYGEARPKPPTLRRRAPKNTKNPSGGWGRAFWRESGSLISVFKSIIPPPARLEGT